MSKSNFLNRALLLLLLYISCMLSSYAFEIVYPPEKEANVTSQYALFVGNANNFETITINNERVYTASNGAFAHTVKLKDGENRVVIRSNFNTQVYKFRKKIPISKASDEVIDIPKHAVVVKKDNTPLRSTPVDAGLNRISHLFEGTTILIDGSKDEFYRVYLAKDKTAWIAKKDVCDDCGINSQAASFINMDSRKFKNAVIQTISFTKNLPYTVEVLDKEILFKVYNPELSDSSVYTLNIPKPEKYFYQVSLNDGHYTFKVCEVPLELEDCTIVIDAGHGGSEKGAMGCLGDAEKDINLKIALELQKLLKDMGANVIMTRECDGTISLDDRVKIAQENKADIFVSIHLNSIGDIPMNLHKNKGTSVFYFNPNSKKLAEILEKSITKSAGTRNDGVRTASFAVIRPTDYVGVLVEAAYMINPYDTLLYKSNNFAYNVAKGIADGIADFVNK